MKRVLKVLAVLLILVTCVLGAVAGWFVHFGKTRFIRKPLPAGSVVVPSDRTLPWKETSSFRDQILWEWADKDLPDWRTEGKGTAPRRILAKLAVGKDIQACNEYLCNQTPWAICGSTWPGNPKGDYDFTLLVLSAILYHFGDDPEILYPETVEHLLDVLLVEEGGEPTIDVPNSRGFIRDTENHLLMTEGSRYLKNRWLALHGDEDPQYDNVANGLQEWMLGFLDELARGGFYEFNSNPYMGYTLGGLLNLEAFANEPVRAAARGLLDRLNWEYAVGSLSLRKFSPFRRQPKKAGLTGLASDYHTAMVTVWMSLHPDSMLHFANYAGSNHALFAAMAPYRLPDKTAQWIESKPRDYFVQIGHGPGAAPECYSGGPGYLLSGGGVNRHPISLLVCRPITLILDDGSMELEEVFHISGPGTDWKKWNSTGVCRNFACAAGPVHTPEGWSPEASSQDWAVYKGTETMRFALHSERELGLLVLYHGQSPEEILQSIQSHNPDGSKLRTSFKKSETEHWTYNVRAPRDQWVIKSINGKPTNRDHDTWPLMEGEI